jgi:hypothetical protein
MGMSFCHTEGKEMTSHDYPNLLAIGVSHSYINYMIQNAKLLEIVKSYPQRAPAIVPAPVVVDDYLPGPDLDDFVDF